mmetsp:Transcript_10845/g.19823  ORF Transcript_10845/g.19823 Transcript_10845/m.19823 type:complete len:295 (+) Transcript_10845:1395-2279(+)
MEVDHAQRHRRRHGEVAVERQQRRGHEAEHLFRRNAYEHHIPDVVVTTPSRAPSHLPVLERVEVRAVSTEDCGSGGHVDAEGQRGRRHDHLEVLGSEESFDQVLVGPVQLVVVDADSALERADQRVGARPFSLVEETVEPPFHLAHFHHLAVLDEGETRVHVVEGLVLHDASAQFIVVVGPGLLVVLVLFLVSLALEHLGQLAVLLGLVLGDVALGFERLLLHVLQREQHVSHEVFADFAVEVEDHRRQEVCIQKIHHQRHKVLLEEVHAVAEPVRAGFHGFDSAVQRLGELAD